MAGETDTFFNDVRYVGYLSLSREELGELVDRAANVDPDPLYEEIADRFRTMLYERGIAVLDRRLELERPEPAIVERLRGQHEARLKIQVRRETRLFERQTKEHGW